MLRRGRRKIRQEPHTERVTTMFSRGQMEIIDRYLKRHPRLSRSAFIRKCVMERIIGDATRHRPSLFDEEEREDETRY